MELKNWDEVKESSYINAEGRYTFTVTEVIKDESGNVTQTSTNGKPYHKYLCTSADGDKITLSLYIIDNALWKYKSFVKACGLEAKGNVDFDTLPQQLIGKKFVGEVKRCAPKMNFVTGEKEESKYFEIAKYFPVA